MKRLLFLFIVSGLAPQSALSAPVSLYRENIPYQWITQPYRFYHGVDFKFSPILSKKFGADYRLTYSLGASAVDLQATYLGSSWSALSPSPGYDDRNNDIDSLLSSTQAQLGLARKPTDSWAQGILELGYSYRGRLIPLDDRYWMQSARFALGYTLLQDQTHHLNFKGFSINTEFSLNYPVSPKVLVGPTLGYRFGWMNRDGVTTNNLNRLPFASLEAAVGATFKL